ncbi:MAG: SusC/RagA family TonB-linked outer membrane protein, partial [Prevotellaceae bacterium]|nr:SusC/RagA family TonB-linked outer membrane protein [Prevotellaceae bacterium]
MKSKQNQCWHKIFLVMLLLIPGAIFAQTGEVRGTVTDAATGDALVGVSVVQKGTANAVVTDANGVFAINVPANAVLQFSYMGYNTAEQVAQSAVLDVKLTEVVTALDEVIVVGYGVQKKSVVTAAISRITTDDLDLENPTTVQNALKGKVSGVQITSNSGQPGADAKIRIRGIGTVNDANPLYVIDGMPSSNGINYLNPSDIASIEILKDAASAAIYGSRGANGVVLVTTKSGKKGTKAQFDYEFSYGFQNMPKKSNLLGSADYQLLMNEMGANSGRGNNYYFPTPSTVNTDWQEELTYANAPLTNHRFSLSGGTERSTYYVSFGILEQSGIFAKGYADFSRYNARLNYTHTLLDTKERSWLNNISFGSRISYSHSKTTGSDIGNSEAGGTIASMNMLPPTEPIFQTDPAKLADYASIYPNHVTDGDGRVYNII